MPEQMLKDFKTKVEQNKSYWLYQKAKTYISGSYQITMGGVCQMITGGTQQNDHMITYRGVGEWSFVGPQVKPLVRPFLGPLVGPLQGLTILDDVIAIPILGARFGN